MPGRPKLRALMLRIRDKGGWGPILERVAAGEGIGKIAKDYNTSRQQLSQQLNHPKRRALHDEAKKLAAEAKVEEAGDVIRDAPHDRDALTKVKLLVEHLRWEASRLDKEQWGDTPQTSVTLNIDSLYLDALKRVNRNERAVGVRAQTASVALPAPETPVS